LKELKQDSRKLKRDKMPEFTDQDMSPFWALKFLIRPNLNFTEITGEGLTEVG